MLLQTNSYIVPKEKRADHARLLRRFRQTLQRLGCEHFECYEQVGPNWTNGESTGRFVQIMRFRDRRHQVAVQAAERSDPIAQQVIAEFCELVNFPYQQQQGLFAVGFYTSVLPMSTRSYQAAQEEADAMAAADEEQQQMEYQAGAVGEEIAVEGADGQPLDEATAEAMELSEQAYEEEPSAEPVPADESIDAENTGVPQEEGFGGYPAEDESEPDAEARHESEPFSRP